MSLWRVRHHLPPLIEMSFVALAALTGVFAIYLASVEPFVVATTAEIRNIAPPVSLDIDAWNRHRNEAYGYEYGVPPDWAVEDTDRSRVIIARVPGMLRAFPDVRPVLVIDVMRLGERRQIENLAAEEFAGTSPALYDVGIDGRPGLFAFEFGKRGVGRQAAYVARDGLVFVFRGDGMDPAVFSTFVSTIHFFIP